MSADSSSMGRSPGRIVVCADDFGMNPAINAGILALAQQGRLSAASVLVDGPALGQAPVAQLLQSGLQIGLHLNFTESFGQPGLCLPLKALIRAAFLRQLSTSQLLDGVQRQLQRFLALFDQEPDYIDGHQHIHQLPMVRDALLQGIDRELQGRPWLRDTGHPRCSGLPWALKAKAWTIASLGATGLRHRARVQGLRQNPGFLGVYDFRGGAHAYQRWLACWLAQAQDGDVLMCHPAQGRQAADPLCAQRQAEFQVLSGEAVGDDLARHQLIIDGAVSLPPEDFHAR